MLRLVRVFGLALMLAWMIGPALAAQPRAYELELSTYFGGSGGEDLRDITLVVGRIRRIARVDHALVRLRTEPSPAAHTDRKG